LSSLKLVTSTSNMEEVRNLVDRALGEMGLSSSEKNSRFLLYHLKALSGRLAIRLVDGDQRTGELIALALVRANCAVAASQPAEWIDLTEGFFVPVDEIQTIEPAKGLPREGERRADLIFVRALPRKPVDFHFIELKYRRHIRSARQPELLKTMAEQTEQLRKRWFDHYFSDALSVTERAVRRAQLSRLLSFYADKAARHQLCVEAHGRIRRETDKILNDLTYEPAEVELPLRGYVFCPELRSGRPERLYAKGDGGAAFYLFGPECLPDLYVDDATYRQKIESPVSQKNPRPDATDGNTHRGVR
jgi:DNA phosphorothioation-dependent restriction protein DptH